MLQKILAKYSECGPAGLLLPIIMRLPGVRALCVYHVYRMPCSNHEASLLMDSYHIEVLDQESSVMDLIGIQDKQEIFRERFRKRHFCFIAYAGNEAVAYLWGQEGPVHVEQRYAFEVPVAANQVFYYDSYTRPEWRQKGLLRCLLQKMALYSNRVLHKSELVAIIEANNLVSQKAHEKIGFYKERLALFIDIMGKPHHVKLLSCQN